MANNLSDVAENLLLDHLNAVTPWTPTAPLKVALYTVAPSDSGGGTEVSGGSYARTNVTFGAAAGGSASNSAAVTFPTATASWGTIVAIAIFDNNASPKMLWYGPLTQSKQIDSGDTFSLPAGNLTVSIS